MKILLKPLFSKLNEGTGSCPLGCNNDCRVAVASHLTGEPCPLSSHQAETYSAIVSSDADIIFNKSETGDGKSLSAYLPGLLTPKFRMVALYPTIELIADQRKQLEEKYFKWFSLSKTKRIDSLYGSELARRVEETEKGNRFKVLLRSLKNTNFTLTNPDIFHLILHFRYYNPATEQGLLPLYLAQFADLYLCDEFHIFGSHQETAILNSLLLIRNARQRKSPLKVLFTSATPKPTFITKLKSVGFRVKEVNGDYTSKTLEGYQSSKKLEGYRQIAQPVELNFVELKEINSLTWLTEKANRMRDILQAESKGRGLIILNSVAQVNQVVNRLQDLLEDQILVKEISGRIDIKERERTREELEKSPKPVLIVATSAVDVGVDFDIHLLIFEVSDAATFIQRLGRLGRHEGFKNYKAFALIPGWMRWVLPQLQQLLQEGEEIDRTQFREETIEKVLSSPQENRHYSNYWGALQAQGMLHRISGVKGANNRERDERLAVTQKLRDRVTQDLRQIYGEQLDKQRGHWDRLGREKTGQAIQEELLRFRGGSDLQAAVWEPEKASFYTYDLLRLLPYAEVEIIDRKIFLEAAMQHNRSENEFPDLYIQIYLKVQSWSEQRNEIVLDCDLGTDELELCTLTLIDSVSVEGHPQSSQFRKKLKNKQLLAFLTPLSRKLPTIWDVRNCLYLSPTFGLYLLTDADGESYACAFNQDAMFLETLKWNLRRCQGTKPYIY